MDSRWRPTWAGCRWGRRNTNPRRWSGPRWSAGVNAAVFALKFGEDAWSVAGRLWSLRLHGEYRFARNWAIGAALDGFDISVDTSKENWNGGFDYGYWGPQIYVTARF